jgi:LytR cell envelope-related transcriptional attenuator
MDDEQSQTATSGSLSIVRAAGVIILFVVAVAILVSVGTRPSVSSTPTTTTTPTTAAAGGATTTTVAGGGAAASTTTTTAAHTTTTKAGHKGKATTTTTAAPSATTVVVANGTSVNGLAAHYSTVIGAGGWTMKTPIDAATSVPTSAVYYAAGQQQQAGSIASTIGVKPAQVLPITTATPVTGATGVDVVVVIGADLASTTTTTT